METAEQKDELFPSIGKVADQADQIEESPAASAANDEVVTEIQSLCMKCHGEVSGLFLTVRRCCAEAEVSRARHDFS
jgi:hypothetical protein